MSYKTVLVHASNEPAFKRALHYALVIGRRFDAHVVALSVVPPAIIQDALTAESGDVIVIEDYRRAFTALSETMRTRFEEAAREAGLEDRHEWLIDDQMPWPQSTVVAAYARSADLTVISQLADEPQVEPHEIVLAAGRPVLIVPARGEVGDVGHRVLVAWNGRREAARAAFDALPLLIGAERVRILWVNPGADEAARDVPSADLATALARHRVRCEAAEISLGGRDVGETLLEEAREMNADLLVMGCYGHSRLREFVLGGASRDVLNHMTLPVLMSH